MPLYDLQSKGPHDAIGRLIGGGNQSFVDTQIGSTVQPVINVNAGEPVYHTFSFAGNATFDIVVPIGKMYRVECGCGTLTCDATVANRQMIIQKCPAEDISNYVNLAYSRTFTASQAGYLNLDRCVNAISSSTYGYTTALNIFDVIFYGGDIMRFDVYTGQAGDTCSWWIRFRSYDYLDN